MTPEEIRRHLDIEAPRLHRYRNFTEKYGIEDFEQFVALYDVDELSRFLPEHPSAAEKVALAELVGVKGEVGYIDYRKSNHTFELIMQWQEKTGNFEQNALFFTSDDPPKEE